MKDTWEESADLKMALAPDAAKRWRKNNRY